ncbi:hypothetical protein LXL04_016174 [Taraxacum kok-saghyz]
MTEGDVNLRTASKTTHRFNSINRRRNRWWTESMKPLRSIQAAKVERSRWCWDLLRTHIFPRTRELPQFPISPKPLFLSKNRLRNPPKRSYKKNLKKFRFSEKKKSFFRKFFFATGLIFERFLAPRSRFFEKVNGLGVLGSVASCAMVEIGIEADQGEGQSSSDANNVYFEDFDMSLKDSACSNQKMKGCELQEQRKKRKCKICQRIHQYQSDRSKIWVDIQIVASCCEQHIELIHPDLLPQSDQPLHTLPQQHQVEEFQMQQANDGLHQQMRIY